MSLLGLDLNASCVRAVWGAIGDYPCTAPLDPPRAELPAALSLEGRTPVAGTAGLRVCRKAPQLACLNILPQIGPPPTANGKTPSHSKLDPAKALGLVLQRALSGCRNSDSAVLALPAYLTLAQIELVLTVACRAGVPVLGSLASPVAVAVAAHAEQAWFGTAIVVDIDDQALTVATVGSNDGQAQLLDVRCFPHLNERAWRERMLNALADCCILESRWDPRESPLAEQSLFDQLDHVLDAMQLGRTVKVTVQTPQRYQNIVMAGHTAVTFCSNLQRQALTEIERVYSVPCPEGAAGTVLLTAAAARLPGLTAALQTSLPHWAPSTTGKAKMTASALEDFGHGLLEHSNGETHAPVVLTASAAARGAHAIGAYFQRGDIACGHLDAAPLPLPLPLEAGPARLHFQGQDYLLGTNSFALGRQHGADLVLDAEQWPHVSVQHCEIIYNHRKHLLCNRCREGTMVNDRPARQPVVLRPGDWIRLGADGPLLRFLGHTV